MQNIFIDILPPWVETGLQPAFYDLESGTVLQQTARMYAKVRELNEAFNQFSKDVSTEINNFEHKTNTEIERFENDTNTEIERFEGVVNATVKEYIDKFVALKDFVDDYFENLDVQEEINNKLDAMVKDGTLQEIIEAYLQPNVAWTFDTVADMQAFENFENGCFAQTLGYYSANDGGGALYKITDTGTPDGGSCIALDTLYAHLVTSDDSVNIRQFGAKGDGTTDDTTAIQNALDYAKVIHVPSGTYYVTSTLTLPYNKKLIGTRKKDCIITIDSTIGNNYILQYGGTFDYGQESGEIKNITFTGPNDSATYSYGVLIKGGIEIDNCYFRYLKQAIVKSNNYIDVIKITRCTVAYCYNTENKYAIDMTNANADGLVIDQLKIASSYSSGNFNEYIGIGISMCYGGSISNSIINAPVVINRCKAFSINNCHFEGTSDSTPDNMSYIKIISSEVTLNNNYMHKRVNGSNIIIKEDQTNPPSHLSNNVTINNFVIEYTDVFLDLFNDFTIYDIEKGNNSTLKLHNCFVMLNFMTTWQTLGEVYGIRIKNMPAFNQHSSLYSFDCFIDNNNNIITDVNKIKPNAEYAVANFFGASASNAKIPWYEAGYNNTTLYYQAIYVLDEDRKLALFKTFNGVGNSVTGVTSGNIASNTKKGVLLRNNKAIYADGLGAYLYIYRGTSSTAYDKLTKVSPCSANYLLDMGTNISGYPTTDRESSDIDTFTYVSDFKTDGQNVEFSAATYPTIGTFVKGDRCINSNIGTGNVIAWVYDGANWISEGKYPS